MIMKAVHRAYQQMEERNWDTIYWAIDLHGVCFKSTYEPGEHVWISNTAVQALRAISNAPESKIILWSAVYPNEQQDIIKFFADEGIKVYGFNQNPGVENTKSGCFDNKFYFSILLDDKAGFDHNTDWLPIKTFLERREMQRKGYEVLG